MSSFLFLHFCDDALWLLGLYFSAFYPFRTFLRWLFTAAVQTSTGASRWSNRACEELPWCSFPYPASKTAHRATQGRVLFFPQNELTPPPKGGGAGYRLSWVGRVGSVRSKLAHTPPTGRVCCFDGVVLLPGPQNRTQALIGPSLVFACFLAHLRRITLPFGNPV